MNQLEQNEAIKKLLDYTAFLRGDYLNLVTHTEKLIELFIAHHFCDRKETREEIIDLLLGDRLVSFESNKQLFIALLKKHKSDFYLQNKNQLNKLQNILEERNKIAHLTVCIINPCIEKFLQDGTVSFLKHGKELRLLDFTHDRVKQMFEDVHNMNILLKTITTYPPSE